MDLSPPKRNTFVEIMATPHDMELHLDAPGLTPTSIDSAGLLRLGAKYLELLIKVAEDQGRGLVFHGFRLEPGSARAIVVASDEEAVVDAADEAARYISGAEVAGAIGVEPLARDVSTAIRRLGVEGDVVVGPWRRPLAPRAEEERSLRVEIVSVRATIVRVGGKTPAVRLSSKAEDFPFTLRVTHADDAPKLGALLYQDADIVATVRRDQDGKILGGTLDEFERIDPGSGVAAWREWFRESCAGWDAVDDVNGELGRLADDGGRADDRH
jgi:hypothetical protein